MSAKVSKERGKQIFKKKLHEALIKTQNFPYIKFIHGLPLKGYKNEQKNSREYNLAKENEREMSARIFQERKMSAGFFL